MQIQPELHQTLKLNVPLQLPLRHRLISGHRQQFVEGVLRVRGAAGGALACQNFDQPLLARIADDARKAALERGAEQQRRVVPRAQLRPRTTADSSPSNRIDDELAQTAAERTGQRQSLPIEIVKLTQQLLAAGVSTYPHQQCRIS